MSIKGYHRDATSSMDSPDDILKCLTCTKPKCNNCLLFKCEGREERHKERSERVLTIKDLHSQGLNDQEIGKAVGLAASTVRYYRLKFGLEVNL